MEYEEKRVKDIMVPVGEYMTINAETFLCDVLQHLKKYHKKIKTGGDGPSHKTMLVIDDSGKFVGKLSFYDFIKGLVPEPAKEARISKKLYSILSSRSLEVVDEVTEIQKRFKWLHSSFTELVKNELQKKVKDVMTPIHVFLEEDDTINKAIFVMFKENVRQPAVTRNGEIIGIVNLMTIFPELLSEAN